MEPEKKELHIVPPRGIEQASRAALILLGVFLAVLTIAQLKGLNYIGTGVSATNTISVSGEGEVFAVPDTAEFSYTVQDIQKDVQSAQATVAKKGNDILAYLKSQGIDEKDIQTTDYSVYPQYDYVNTPCPMSSDGSSYPCGGKQVLRGYQASETVTVKVRDADKAGALLSGVGSKGATNVSSLSFTVADQKALEVQARGKAIADARAKADELAKQLGVSLVRVVGYAEGGDGRVYYAKAMDMAVGGAPSAAPAPEISMGQNKITSSVTISYEIR